MEGAQESPGSVFLSCQRAGTLLKANNASRQTLALNPGPPIPGSSSYLQPPVLFCLNTSVRPFLNDQGWQYSSWFYFFTYYLLLRSLCGKKPKTCLVWVSVRNVINLSKLHGISYVDSEGGQRGLSEVNVGVRCKARIPGELLALPGNNNVNEHFWVFTMDLA